MNIEDIEFEMYNHKYASFLLAALCYASKTLPLDNEGDSTITLKIIKFVFDSHLLEGLSSAETVAAYVKYRDALIKARNTDSETAAKSLEAFVDAQEDEEVGYKGMTKALARIYALVSHTPWTRPLIALIDRSAILSAAFDLNKADLRNYLTMAGVFIGEKYINSALGFIMFESSPADGVLDYSKLHGLLSDIYYHSPRVMQSTIIPETEHISVSRLDVAKRLNVLSYFNRGLFIPKETDPAYYVYAPLPPSSAKGLAWRFEGQHAHFDNVECTGQLSNFSYMCSIVYALKISSAVRGARCKLAEAAFRSMAVLEGEILSPFPRRMEAVVKQFTFLYHLLQCLLVSPDNILFEAKELAISDYIRPFTKAYLNAYDKDVIIPAWALRFLCPPGLPFFPPRDPRPVNSSPVRRTPAEFAKMGAIMSYLLSNTVGSDLLSPFIHALQSANIL